MVPAINIIIQFQEQYKSNKECRYLCACLLTTLVLFTGSLSSWAAPFLLRKRHIMKYSLEFSWNSLGGVGWFVAT